MICIHHSRDLDGWCSAAIVKKYYPDCTLIGYDYKDKETPLDKIPKGEKVIIIDVSLEMEDMEKLLEISNNQLTWIDHHISKRNDYIAFQSEYLKSNINYIFDDTKSACEIAWNYFYPLTHLPKAIELLSNYDIWKFNGTPKWDDEILPFQYFMRLQCNSAETFPKGYLEILKSTEANTLYENKINIAINIGKNILKYQEMQNETLAKNYAFEREFEGYKAICVNTSSFSSLTVKSVYNPKIHKIMLGFVYDGSKYVVSLRSEGDIDVSLLAKRYGGGGHKNASGFTIDDINKILK